MIWESIPHNRSLWDQNLMYRAVAKVLPSLYKVCQNASMIKNGLLVYILVPLCRNMVVLSFPSLHVASLNSQLTNVYNSLETPKPQPFSKTL